MALKRYKIEFEIEVESFIEAKRVLNGIQNNLTPTGHKANYAVLSHPDQFPPNPSQEEDDALYDLMLDEPGDALISVIKEVRGLTNLGLKEAKDLVDSTRKHNPSTPVLTNQKESLATKGLEILERAGAQVHIERTSLTQEEIKESITKLISTEQELAS